MKMYSSFSQIQSLIQISHKLNWFGIAKERRINDYFCLKTTYKIATKINVVININACLSDQICVNKWSEPSSSPTIQTQT